MTWKGVWECLILNLKLTLGISGYSFSLLHETYVMFHISSLYWIKFKSANKNKKRANQTTYTFFKSVKESHLISIPSNLLWSWITYKDKRQCEINLFHRRRFLLNFFIHKKGGNSVPNIYIIRRRTMCLSITGINNAITKIDI